MTSTTLQKHYLRILRLWPQDALRSLTVQDSLQRRLSQRLIPPSQQQPLTPPQLSQQNWVDSAAEVGGNVPTPAQDADAEMRQVNALYSLLENRYSRMYPVSEQQLRPAFRPSYYAELATEMEAAPKRGWFARKWLRWGQLVRFQ